MGISEIQIRMFVFIVCTSDLPVGFSAACNIYLFHTLHKPVILAALTHSVFNVIVMVMLALRIKLHKTMGSNM